MNALVDLLTSRASLSSPLARLLAIVLLGLFAWTLVGVASRAAAWLVARGERRGRGLHRRKEEETAISLIRTSIRYLVWSIALVLSLTTAFGAHGIQTLVGASFVAIILGFAAQRFLIDLIAGAVMFFEGWFRVGDTIRIVPWDVEGVVEEVSLRAIVVRGVGGELQRVHNSQILAVKMYPRGHRQAEIDLVVRDAAQGRALVDAVVPLLPLEPTRFVYAPELVDDHDLGGGLTMLRLRAAVIPGREWLVESLLPALLRERGGDEPIVHGPVVSFVDEVAQRRFGRLAAVATRDGAERRTAA
jgi:moderate conductance mechanosensitive channel